MTCFRAALNQAYLNGLLTTDFSWRSKLRPINNADQRRELYLDRAQRLSFVEKATTDLGAFLRGLCQLPLRPGALAKLKAGDFDRRLKVLKIGKEKSGKDRRIKLPNVAAEYFETTPKDKLPTAPRFSRGDGKAWNKDASKGPAKAAAELAELSDGITAHILRHSVIAWAATEPRCFDNPGLPIPRVTARMLAMELHEWWVAWLRRNLIIKARLSHEDLILLQHQAQPHSSKKIATDWQVKVLG